MSMTKSDGAPVGDRLRENDEERPDFRDEELSHAFDALVKSVHGNLNDRITVDGLPPARNESQAEAMGDIRGSLTEADVRSAILEGLPVFFRRYFEIIKQ